MTPPARTAEPGDAEARLAKAREFAEAAQLLHDDQKSAAYLPDAYVTSAVHSGIASADVICIRLLAKYSVTGNHDEALKLLGQVDKAAASNLQRLLALKTKAGYSTRPVSAADVSQARRAHLALLEAANAAR